MFLGTNGFSPKELCGRLLPMGVGGKVDLPLLGAEFFSSSVVGYIRRFGLSAVGGPTSWKPETK